MNQSYPVYTEKNECHDCYKCIRHCPSKAIRIKDGSASVIPELCVACGLCVKVCPAGAKHIREDLSRARFLLSRNHKVYVSLAPSWRSAFREVGPGQMVAALKQLGFAGVGETALGAQAVSAETGKMLHDAPPGIYISSACPAAVDYIRKYLPEHAGNITQLKSPVLAHTMILRRHLGEDIGVVFIGPCAAKKQEADRHPDMLDLALTFKTLQKWFEQEGIEPGRLPPNEEKFVPEAAEEGKIYAIEGGMIETVREETSAADICYITLSGLPHIDQVLSGERAPGGNVRLFIECLACEGGCINGPGMPGSGNKLSDILAVAMDCRGRSSLGRRVEVPVALPIRAEAVHERQCSEKEITAALAAVGKYSKADELNCGGCGYQTCRGFAAAVVAGKAEPDMCLSYLRRLAQKKSNALIKYIPAGVVIVDGEMRIVECNLRFAAMFDDSTRIAYEARPGLLGVDLRKIVPFADLFEVAMASGKDVCRENHVMGDKILDIDIFTVEPHRIVGAILQDVTQAELRREQISQKAREVIMKNVITVQKIANYLGEHMAETEILLREVASGYEAPKPPVVKTVKDVADDDR
ncbi:MAG: [Fe-Fe] hydrogenase large subunit C-terminal domain-containing protein [Victivallales bacterium]|nr:[Fe-Fe] hydrogenase large subunit C-terminal domain-containing protein [Victivallales bacterium]